MPFTKLIYMLGKSEEVVTSMKSNPRTMSIKDPSKPFIAKESPQPSNKECKSIKPQLKVNHPKIQHPPIFFNNAKSNV